MKPTLLILAAGMGSRFGGLKQIEGLGPNGETIMDYSVYDAVRAGFGKIVFVIRRSFEKDFREIVLKKYESAVPVEVVFQELENIPEGYTYNKERIKPWGTNHAILMAKGVINEIFAVINADDFYGKESFQILHDYLVTLPEGKQNEYCMVGYRVGNTLSESGTVSRGVCSCDDDRFLTSVVERNQIERIGGTVQYTDKHGQCHKLENETPVSMNMWGFTPDYFDYSLDSFKEFLQTQGDEPKSEFYIPTMVNNLVSSGKATVKVLDTPSKWFGVTYAEDRSQVVLCLNELITSGVYPTKLWK